MTLAIDQVVAAVAADFALRAITAEVLFGSWKPSEHNGADRVIFGVATFEPGSIGRSAPGPVAIGATQEDARELDTCVEAVDVWVHARPPGDPTLPTWALEAQRATAALRHQTIAALYRYAHGSFSWRGGRWLVPERQEFVFGSALRLVALFRVPVFDDALARVDAADASWGTQGGVLPP